MTATAIQTARISFKDDILLRGADALHAIFGRASREFDLSVDTQKLAVRAYSNQRDKDGISLFDHIHTAVAMLDELYPNMDAAEKPWVRALVMLHEVLELKNARGNRIWSPGDILRRGFSPWFVTRLEALTHQPNEPYLRYIWRASEYPETIKAKRSDFKANLMRKVINWNRMSARLRDKKNFLYAASDEYLEAVDTGKIDRNIISPFDYIVSSPKWMKIVGNPETLRKYWDESKPQPKPARIFAWFGRVKPA